MKILILTPLFPPNTGGAATYFNLLFQKLLQDNNVQIAVVLAEKEESSPLILRMGHKGIILRLLPRLGSIDNYVELGHLSKAILIAYRSLALLILLPIITRTFKINVVHFHSTFGHIRGNRRNYLFEIALKLCRGKKICDVRDARGIPLTGNLADHYIAASLSIYKQIRNGSHIRDALLQYIPVPIESDLTRGCLSTKVKPLKETLPKSFFCFVGEMNKVKGIFVLLKAHKQLLESQSYPLSLVLIGRDKTRGNINKYLSKRTIYLGELPHDNVLQVICNSEFLVLPSFSEGLPRVCLEALALGKPVICPPGIEEFNEYLSDFILKEITVEEIIDKIRTIMSGNPKQIYPVQNHDFELLYNETKKIYLCLLSE
jgi:glycosyltransferase involved in cell wall biosynthesis